MAGKLDHITLGHDTAIHAEPVAHERPYHNITHNKGQHDVTGAPYQHPNTAYYVGIDAPGQTRHDMLKEQMSQHGFSLSHKEEDTTQRFYTDQDVKRSCPSV
jgi:hypothetical protein